MKYVYNVCYTKGSYIKYFLVFILCMQTILTKTHVIICLKNAGLFEPNFG